MPGYGIMLGRWERTGLTALFRIVLCAGAAAALCACGTAQRPMFGAANEREVELRVLMGYDFDESGTLTRAELDAGLVAAFGEADRDGDSQLDAEEAGAENQRRWAAEGPAASPLIDWDGNGRIDAAEFSSTARTLFGNLDRDENALLDAFELRVPPTLRAQTPGEMAQGRVEDGVPVSPVPGGVQAPDGPQNDEPEPGPPENAGP